jgi:hypothetical protein
MGKRGSLSCHGAVVNPVLEVDWPGLWLSSTLKLV